MIDSHCHLEQKEYFNDLDGVIQSCKKGGLKAVVTSCPDPRDFDRSLEIVNAHPEYVFLCSSIHPQFIKEFTAKQVDEYFDRLKANKSKLVAVGECGLDFFWIKEEEWREKQKDLFIQHIELSRKLKLPLVIHSRDAWEDVLKILEQEDTRKVLLHFWGGKEFTHRVIENNYSITIGPVIAKSKSYKKIACDFPIENILLETDSPWFGANGERGIPTNIRVPCEEIAEVKKLEFKEVWEKCGNNAEKFFNLDLK